MSQNRYYSSTAQQATITDNPLTAGATTINVSAVTGFPTSYPYTLIIERDTAREEVVTVTAGAGLVLTVTRGVDGTTAVQHSQGVTVEHGVSARDFDEPQAHIADSGIHGSRSPWLITPTLDPIFCGTNGIALADSMIHYYKWRCQESGTIDFASVYIKTAGAANSAVKVGILADASGAPGALLGYADSVASIGASLNFTGWAQLVMDQGGGNVDVTQGHDYWVAVQNTAGSGAATFLCSPTMNGASQGNTDSLFTRMKQGTGATLTSTPTTAGFAATSVLSVVLIDSNRQS